MADNITLNSGTGGDVVAADDIGPGVKYQRVKVTLGADGTNDGDVASGNPMPISGAVTNTVLSVVGNGAAATAQRVTLANDSTGTVVVTQGTATNLKAQAEMYQGGVAVGAAAPLQVSLANHGANATAVKVDGSAVTQPVSGTVTASQGTAANLNATVVGTGTFATQATLANPPAPVTGSGSLTGTSQAVTLTLLGRGNAAFHISGTWSATITFQGTVDDTNWENIFAMKAGDNVIAQTATANDIYRVTCAGFLKVRANCTAFTSGTVVISALASDAVSGTFLNFPLPPGTNYAGKVRLTDGTLDSSLVDETGASAVDALAIGGGTPHDAVDSGNPLKLGAKAETAPSGITLVADGDRTNLYADADGILMTKPFTAYGDILVERLTNTDGASTASTVFGATANARNCITTIAVHNSSGTAGFIDFRDGTAGTVLFTMPLPANSGSICNFPLPLRQTTVNTAFAYDVSAALTTVYISLIGFKSKA